MAYALLKIPCYGASLASGIVESRLFETKAGRLELITDNSGDLWDSLSFETGNDGYTIIGSAARSTEKAMSGSYSIKIPYGSGSPAHGMCRQFAVPSSGCLVVEKAFNISQLLTSTAGAVQVAAFTTNGSNDFRGPHCGITGDYQGASKGHFGFYDGDWSILTQISLDTWYIVIVVANLSTNRYDLYLLNSDRSLKAVAHSVGYHNAGAFTGQTLYDQTSTWNISVAGDVYIDAVSNGYKLYSNASPVATLQKIGGGNTGQKWTWNGSGLWLPENIGISGSPQAPKYQYGLFEQDDEGDLTWNGMWLTQAELRTAIGTTQQKRWLKLQAQLNSDGNLNCAIDDGYIPAVPVGGGGNIFCVME
jgi:hypothetical protein